MATVLDMAIVSVLDTLQDFAHQDNFWNLFEIAFGSGYDHARAEQLREQWQTGEGTLPSIELVAEEVLGTAQGAYASERNTIYLRADFVAIVSQDQLVQVLLEEYGHYIDAQVNGVDSYGDEGAIFAALAQGQELDPIILQGLKIEDDHALITVNGHLIAVEQATFTGTNGNDNIPGTSGDDTISPLRGQDNVDGGTETTCSSLTTPLTPSLVLRAILLGLPLVSIKMVTVLGMVD